MDTNQAHKKQRIQPQLVSVDLTQNPPIETVIACKTCSLDKKFARVFQKPKVPMEVSNLQKQYIKDQEELFDNEIYLLDTMANHLRDLLEAIYQFKMRQEPDRNVDLFCELGYKSFKRHRECDELMQHLKGDIQVFRDEEEDDEEDNRAQKDEVEFGDY